MVTLLKVESELKNGGDWLGAARRWMQRNIYKGDTIEWSSNEIVKVPFYMLEELAKTAAVAAVTEERQRVAKELARIKRNLGE